MAKLYYNEDADLGVLNGKKVAILGYGSQGHAHALNLKDSGVDVVVAQRPGSKNYDLAVSHGFTPVSVKEAAEIADVIVVLLPDEKQKAVYEQDIAP
ncbi:MAG TPA: NAD(P)-binding domain-containing protein, partial [Bacillota bacterium]|nr:NAD(P)-binding domain-containing protein [Bacillota bacterium]